MEFRQAARSDFDLDADDSRNSQAGGSSLSITKWDQPANVDRRTEKIRMWRRRVLLRRGARLHMTIAGREFRALAALGEVAVHPGVL